MHERTRWRLIFAGAFVAPMAIVKATELYLNRAAPQQAAAVSSASAPSTMHPEIEQLLSGERVADASLSQQQGELLTYVSQVRRRPLVRSPFEPPVSSRQGPERVIEPTPEPTPELHVTIQAVMRTAGGNLALINGMTYRVGETINDRDDENANWIIREINAVERSVRFEHSTSAVEEIRIVQP